MRLGKGCHSRPFLEYWKFASIIEFAAVAYSTIRSQNRLGELAKRREGLKNCYKDIAKFLSSIWKKLGSGGMELAEYEDYYDISDFNPHIYEKNVRYFEILNVNYPKTGNHT